MYSEIKNELKNRNYKKAFELTQIAINSNPIESKLYYLLAVTSHYSGHNSFALNAVQIAIEMEEEDSKYKILEIKVLMSLSKNKIALGKIDELPLKERTKDEILGFKAYCLYRNNRVKEAIKLFEFLLINNQSSRYLISLAHCFCAIQDYTSAINSLKKAKKIDPNNPSIYNNLGYYKLKQNKPFEAIPLLQKAIKLDPQFPNAHNNLGYAYLLNRDFHKSLKLIMKSIKLDNRNSYAFKNLGKYYIAINEEESAYKSLVIAKGLGYNDFYDNEVNELLEKIGHNKY